ncbi:hypothetical protein SAMN06297387_1032 [Streptomyces zhaozhouensis]|uniref:Uncharacterized protein n=1 Tax=Streptomyces zhaozhouensis TaxID=1300267 RepID=A0A286DR59_9ACTN|nr:hypothetical protein [Streptomyces zhaozhouensis]SOD61155.1 hypothetical protein SAMN06297387_1032 [Streptomyces zhaozhouensis]
MRHRALLLALFLVPAFFGVVRIGDALTASDEVVCPGENVRGGEEHPGPMRPGDTECSVLNGSTTVGTRSYEQQRRVQSGERQRDAVDGTLLLVYGAGGALVVWSAARSRASRD